jgi:hypothetical protein
MRKIIVKFAEGGASALGGLVGKIALDKSGAAAWVQGATGAMTAEQFAWAGGLLIAAMLYILLWFRPLLSGDGDKAPPAPLPEPQPLMTTAIKAGNGLTVLGGRIRADNGIIAGDDALVAGTDIGDRDAPIYNNFGTAAHIGPVHNHGKQAFQMTKAVVAEIASKLDKSQPVLVDCIGSSKSEADADYLIKLLKIMGFEAKGWNRTQSQNPAPIMPWEVVGNTVIVAGDV